MIKRFTLIDTLFVLSIVFYSATTFLENRLWMPLAAFIFFIVFNIWDTKLVSNASFFKTFNLFIGFAQLLFFLGLIEILPLGISFTCFAAGVIYFILNKLNKVFKKKIHSLTLLNIAIFFCLTMIHYYYTMILLKDYFEWFSKICLFVYGFILVIFIMLSLIAYIRKTSAKNKFLIAFTITHSFGLGFQALTFFSYGSSDVLSLVIGRFAFLFSTYAFYKYVLLEDKDAVLQK